MKKRIVSMLMALIMLIGLIPAAAMPAFAASNLETSDAAIEILKSYEGFEEEAYELDGKWYVGYGFIASEGDTMTREEADKVLVSKLDAIDAAINKLASKYELKFSQNEHDALALFSYNCGTGWTAHPEYRFTSAVINEAAGNDFIYVMSLWCTSASEISKGLLNRRLAEAQMYLNGTYSTKPAANYTYVLLDTNEGELGEAELTDKVQGYNSNVAVAVKPVPTLDGYQFMGWYTKAEGGTPVTVLSDSHAGKTLYAHWQGGEDVTDDEGEIVGTKVSYTMSASKAASLNVYETPSTDAEVLKTLKKTDEMSVVAEYIDENDVKWVQLKKSGWVSLGKVGQTTVSTTSVTVTVTASALNVRKTAGVTTDTPVGKVYAGDKLTITQVKTVNGAKWGCFENSELSGWVSLMYTNYETASQQQSSSENGTVIGTGVVTNSYVNIRSGAGTNYTLLGTLKQGDSLKFYEFKTVNGVEWGRYDTGRWVCLQYVSVTKNSTDSDSTTSTTVTTLDAVAAEDLVIYNTDGTETGATLKAGTTVKVSELGVTEDGIIMAKIPGGWVEAELLTIELPEAEQYIVSGVQSGLNVRENAGDTESEPVAALKNDTIVIVYELKIVGDTVWAYIVSDEAEGWVNADYLAEYVEEEEPSEDEDTTPEVDSGLKTGTISGADVVNVRSSAGVRYDNLVGTLKRGSKVTIYEEVTKDNAKWARIGENQWVAMQYVTVSNTTTGGSTGSTGNSGSTGTTTVSTGVVNSSINLNVRSGAGLAYDKIASLTPGTEVTIYEQELNNGMIWGRIKAGTVEGWVCMSYVLTTSTGSTGTGVMGTIVNTYTGVNIRSAPGTGNALLGKILTGTRVEIFEQTKYGASYWGRVAQGWICMDYVLLDSDLPTGGIPGVGDSTTGGTTTEPGITHTAAAGTIAATVANVSDELSIRKEASLDSEIVGNVDKGTTVYISALTIDEEEIEWAKIDGGWVRANYLAITTPADYTVVNISEALNVRAEANTSAEVLATLKNGAKATLSGTEIIEDADGKLWVKISVSGVEGWVRVNYLKPGYTAATTPAPDAGTTTPDAGTTTPAPDAGTTTPTVPSTGNVGTGLGSTTTTANNAYGYLYTGTVWGTGANTLKVRQTASTGANVITELDDGDAVVIYETVISEYMAWGRCDAGWICLTYVDLVPYNSTATDARVVQTFAGATIYDAVNGAAIGSYAKSAVIDIYEISGTWARTIHGWVSIYDLQG